MTDLSKAAQRVALAYGPAFTKAIKEGDQSTFQDLFVADESVSVILQNAKGEELHFTLGNQPDATMNWSEFYQVTSQDLAKQDYSKTESICLGILGDRMILETGRFNKAGEVYLEAYALVTLNDKGKIIMFESFSNVNASTLVGAAENE